MWWFPGYKVGKQATILGTPWDWSGQPLRHPRWKTLKRSQSSPDHLMTTAIRAWFINFEDNFMTLPNKEFPTPRTIQETPVPATTQNDPLIAKGLQREQYIGIFILAIGLIAAVGFFSRRVEYALLFA